MAALHQPLTGRILDLFLSYAREDAPALRVVEEGLETLHHRVWIDRKLSGGQAWWDEILTRIRQCDAAIVAVSPALLESDAATREREYARALGKPLLPVLVAPVLTDLLPPDIASLQLVDFTNVGPMTGLRLAAALAALPPAPELPNPLPVPPPEPIGPVAGLVLRLRGENLPLEEQLAIVASLRHELERARERAAALEVVRSMRRRRDLYHATWQELDELLRNERAVRDDQPSIHIDPVESPPTGPVPAPDWYPDPSGRHQLRWFDGDWTRYASDYGAIVEDPDF